MQADKPRVIQHHVENFQEPAILELLCAAHSKINLSDQTGNGGPGEHWNDLA